MPDDVRALIEEARGLEWQKFAPYTLACRIARLADALEAEASARLELVDKIEALASVIPIMHERIMRGGPTNYLDRWDGYMDRTQRDLIRGLVSSDSRGAAL